MGGVAAFFDLDRTLIARSSALALAGAFRRQGLLSRRELAQASLLQLLFTLRGASSREAERMAARGILRLRGLTREQLQELFDATVEPLLKPLAYREALELAEQHRRRGERTYLASASLAELVRLLAAEFGFDGWVGTVAELRDGCYTGRSLSICLGEAKADALRRLATEEGVDLAASTAYSDSHSDLPFLEAVGNPVAVNPDRRLRLTAQRRGWPILHFHQTFSSSRV